MYKVTNLLQIITYCGIMEAHQERPLSGPATLRRAQGYSPFLVELGASLHDEEMRPTGK